MNKYKYIQYTEFIYTSKHRLCESSAYIKMNIFFS